MLVVQRFLLQRFIRVAADLTSTNANTLSLMWQHASYVGYRGVFLPKASVKSDGGNYTFFTRSENLKFINITSISG